MDCKVETGCGRFLIAQYFGLKAKLTFIKFLEKLSKNISVAVPDLQIMGARSSRSWDKEGARSQKKTKKVSALRGSVWSENKAGAFPWIRHCEFGVTIFKNDKIVKIKMLLAEKDKRGKRAYRVFIKEKKNRLDILILVQHWVKG